MYIHCISTKLRPEGPISAPLARSFCQYRSTYAHFLLRTSSQHFCEATGVANLALYLLDDIVPECGKFFSKKFGASKICFKFALTNKNNSIMSTSEIKQSFFVIRQILEDWHVIEYRVVTPKNTNVVRARCLIPSKQSEEIENVIFHSKLTQIQRRKLYKLVQNSSIVFIADINYILTK